jgi:transposase
MTQTDPRSEATPKQEVIYCAIELSGKNWRVAFSRGDLQVRERVVECGQIEGVVREFDLAQKRFGMSGQVRRLTCYEAGRDGFWIHRALLALGIEGVVIDPSSLEVDRRQKTVKTDRLDVRRILSALIRYDRGEKSLRVVRVPSVEQEDARRVNRERSRLKQESTGHRNRIRALLVLHGIRAGGIRGKAKARAKLLALKSPTGEPIPGFLRSEIERELLRLELVEQHIDEIDKSRKERLDAATLQKVEHLTKLRGVGETGGQILVQELFGWRQFKNRRQLGALVGLTPAPFNSGGSERDQGISKAGSRRLRALLIQLAWGWLRYQPRSALALWFFARFGGGVRSRKVGIVALARRLLIALWRFVDQGVLPEGAIMSA